MINTILGTSKGPPTFSSIAFIVLSFLPAVLGLFTLADNRWPPLFTSTMTRREVQEMGRNGIYKQEILSFGLTDWVIEKWNQASDAMFAERQSVEESRSSVSISLVRDSVETVGYVSPVQTWSNDDNLLSRTGDDCIGCLSSSGISRKHASLPVIGVLPCQDHQVLSLPR